MSTSVSLAVRPALARERGRAAKALDDAYEIVHGFPSDMHGKKEALENLIGATANLITAYGSAETNSEVGRSFALGGLNKLRDALRGLGFKAEEQQEMISRVYGS